MRIAFVVMEYPPVVYGGLGVYAKEVTLRISEMGHEVHVFSINPGGLPRYSIYDGVHVRRFKFINATSSLNVLVNDELRRWGSGFRYFNDIFIYNIASALSIVHEMIEENKVEFDVVSVHDWLSSIAGMTVKDELSHMPLVFHVHSTEKGRNLGGGSPTVSMLELKCAEKADAIITVSQAMKDYDLAPQGFPIDKVHVVWNGVDPQKYSPSRVPRDEINFIRAKYGVVEGSLILFVGRLVQVKGVDKLIESMQYIAKDYPKSKLIVVGQGDLYQYLVDLANKLGISNHVIFVNKFMDEREKIAYYAACDVAVFPSLYEPFGIIALEAMAMEKPVVVGAKDCSGLREIVVPSGAQQCGVHVNPYDPRDIAWGISAVLSSQDMGRWMGINGRKRVLENFTWDHAASKTLEIYKSLAKQRR
ncbi:MAG: glycosyltransferase family 4 protein [Candidatus Nezhaarchaeales archaeon]